jgi:hypothetical protein
MSRPKIPEKIKREVRKRCGFGCVICGLPVYEYDHIVEYSKTKRHVASELTLLCPLCHTGKTKGHIAVEDVIEANKYPHNKKQGISSPYAFRFSGDKPEIHFAGVKFICSYQIAPAYLYPIMIDKKPLFGFTVVDGGLLLNMEVRDKEGKKILKIRDSQLQVADVAWDITLVGKTLIIRERLRHSIVEVDFCPPNTFKIKRYKVSSGEVTVEINDNTVNFTGANIPSIELSGDGSGVFDGNVGIAVGEHPKGLGVCFSV